jgi:hypothetical protein
VGGTYEIGFCVSAAARGVERKVNSGKGRRDSTPRAQQHTQFAISTMAITHQQAQEAGSPPGPAASQSRRGSRWRVAACLILGALWAVAHSSPVAAERPTEYDVKAAFLYSFPSFVGWPNQALPDTASILTIGILGEDPFGDAFRAFAHKAAGGRLAKIKRSTRLQELPLCHVLFICNSERRYLPQILEHLRGRPVLTVGDTDGFAEAGVMMNFRLEENRVRFDINSAAAERASLVVSAKLLKLARIVQEDPR